MLMLYDKLKLLKRLMTFSLLLLAMGCKQDAIFYYISGETAPTKPRIQGSPSKIVSVDTNGAEEGGKKLYIANGRLWEYDISEPAARWNRSSGPRGYVADVASTFDGALYALAIDNTSTAVWKKTNETGWTTVAPPAEYGFIQNIFGVGDVLFATGTKRTGDDYDYAILYCRQPNSEFTVVNVVDPPLGASYLSGAGKIGGNYYLATMGKGVYKTSDLREAKSAEAIDGKGIPANIAGFFQTTEPEAIIGISRNGYVLYMSAAGLRVDDTSLGGTYTGALALMDLSQPHEGFDKLLLLGYRGSNSSYEHGYMELLFKSGDGTHEGTRRTPGSNAQISSVSDYRQYDSSARRYPAAAFWVLERSGNEESPVIFASTSNQGLYSYRNRSDGGWQWNHEE
ncbi:MAG: hypothetical protein LBU16_02505 [Treponema sp.]|jgi:hypothetical protein|nr:hypothetical protein [Treponema sp.]